MAETVLLRRFFSYNEGNFGIIFGLMLAPMLGLAGAAIDYSMLHNRQLKIQSAADIALLAAARDAPTSTEFYRLAENYLAANLDGIQVETIAKANPKNVSLSISSDFETSFLALIGHKKIGIKVYSEVAVDKFGRGSTQTTGYSNQALMNELDDIEAQLLKQIYKLRPRDQEKARMRIRQQMAHLRRQASAAAGSDDIYLAR